MARYMESPCTPCPLSGNEKRISVIEVGSRVKTTHGAGVRKDWEQSRELGSE